MEHSKQHSPALLAQLMTLLYVILLFFIGYSAHACNTGTRQEAIIKVNLTHPKRIEDFSKTMLPRQTPRTSLSLSLSRWLILPAGRLIGKLQR